MGKKPLIIREINMRKVPGFPSGIIAIKGLARNINLVAGPNASGKSTTAKAIRQVLWPQDFKKQDIECRLELEGQLWDIRLDHGDYHSQRGGIDDKLPHLPAVEESKRYSLALHELVKDDDTDLAIQVGREMSGGFNLPQAEQNLGFDAKFKPRTISERKAYGEAEEKVRKIEAGQVQLKDREQKLENLQAEKAKALQARTWEKLFTAASACTEARAAFGELSDRLKLYPEQLAMMRGNEADELDGLEKDINNYTKKVERAQEDAEKKKTQLRSLDLPDVGINKQLLDELDTRVIAVLDIEKELNRLAVETSTAEQALVHALRSISKELEHKGEIDIQLSDVAALEKFLSDAHRVMSEKQVLESNLAAARERAKSVSVSNDQLNEGIRLLILWFKEPEGTAQNKAPWLWALVAAGILTALAVYFLGWIGLVGGIILVVLGVLGGRTETGNQADIRRKDYQRTGLAQPKNWDNEEVLRVLNELTGQLQAGKNAEMAQQEIAIYEADLEKVTARELVVNEQRDSWLEKLAFVPELPKADLKNYGGLYWCLLALRDYQLAYSELAAAQSASTTLQKQQGEQFLAINSLLDGLHAPVHSGPAARASHKKLVEDETARQRLAEAIGEIAGHIGEWQAEKNRAAAKLAALFQRLEIPEGNNEELYDLFEQLESYQAAAKKCEEKQFELKDRTAQLESHEWYEKIREEIDGLTVENARLKEQQHKTEADKLDHLNEQITGIVTLIAEAMKGHVLEDALADRESALENLENAYEKNLAALTGSLIGSKLKETSRASRNSDVFERANRLFNRITNGRYELLIDDTNAAAFKALDTASNQGQDLSILSTGTRIQLLLSVRLAFIESQEKDIKLPVMADEILANSDDQRAQQIIEALVEISKEGRQVFYFTSQADEIAKWQAYRDVDPGLEIAMVTLGGTSNNYFDHTLNVQPALALKAFNSYPEPGTMSRLDYGNALKFPVFRLLTDRVEQLHLWYLMEDLQLLYNCLQNRITTYGQLDSFQKHGGTIRGLSAETWQSLKETARLLNFYQELYAQGRPKPIDRQVLADSGAVSGNFIDAAAAKLKELGNDPEKLVSALRSGAVSRFSKSKADELEQYLLKTGYLDDRPQISDEDILIRLQAFLSNYTTSRVEAEAFLKQF